jgi:hypothetical protein
MCIKVGNELFNIVAIVLNGILRKPAFYAEIVLIICKGCFPLHGLKIAI